MPKRRAGVNPRIRPWIVPVLAVGQFAATWAVAALLAPAHVAYAITAALTALSFLLMVFLLVWCTVRSRAWTRTVRRLAVPRNSAFARRDGSSP